MVTFAYEVNSELLVKVVIIDLLGHEIYRKEFTTTKGTNMISYDAAHLTPGVYMFSIDNGLSRVNEKILKVK